LIEDWLLEERRMAEASQRCVTCRALLDEEDLFCANCGAESPLGQRDPAKLATANSAHNFDCEGCGASMSYDASAQSLRCPFCGSTKLREQPDARVLAPSRVIPFVLSRDQAQQAMRTWLATGFWRPGDLARTAQIEHLQPVYVPYWVFDARTHSYWTADSSQVPLGARAAWLPITGEQRGEYAGLMVGASGALTPAETHSIAPFDLGDAVPPDRVDLDNAIFEQFRVQRKYARPLAQQGLESLEMQACRAYVPGQCRNLKVNVLLDGLTSEPVLFPVWIMAYRYRQQVFRFLVNGQTGRATGQAPTDWRKIAMVTAIVVLGVLAALAAIAIVGGVAGRQ